MIGSVSLLVLAKDRQGPLHSTFILQGTIYMCVYKYAWLFERESMNYVKKVNIYIYVCVTTKR